MPLQRAEPTKKLSYSLFLGYLKNRRKRNGSCGMLQGKYHFNARTAISVGSGGRGTKPAFDAMETPDVKQSTR